MKGSREKGSGRLCKLARGEEKPAPDSRPEAGGGVGVQGPVLTILTMPRCTVGTAGPPEEPPLCAEEAMCRDGKTTSKAADQLGGVNVGVGIGERPPRQESTGDWLRSMDWTDTPGAHKSSSGTGYEKEDAISAAATRSTRRASVPERHRPPAN